MFLFRYFQFKFINNADASFFIQQLETTQSQTDLSEEPLAASTGRRRVVDVDVVVLGADRLFHKRLLEDFSVHLHVVLALHQVTL